MVPEKERWRYVFHMTDMRNLDSIIKNGLLCYNDLKDLKIEYNDIANSDIQKRRAAMTVPCGRHGTIHDYVPFYFASRTRMLLGVINKKNIDQQFIVSICLKITRLDELDSVFTNASANTEIPPQFYDDTSKLSLLRWDDIDNKSWKVESDDIEHAKMAEALFYKTVPIKAIDCIVVFNPSIQKYIEQVFSDNGYKKPKICFDGGLNRYHFYYTKFTFPGRGQESLVTGPEFLYYYFNQLITNIASSRATEKQYAYKDIDECLKAISENFCVLPELEGIYHLQTDNPMHRHTVDEHTFAVVSNILQFEHKYSHHDFSILLLSAYFHDIGKGPISKWEDGIQKSYQDHPADAIPMLQRILSECIEILSEADVHTICLLVIYHDLIGDIVSHGRSIEQLTKIINNEKEYDMLLDLSLADSMSIDKKWHDNILEKAPEIKEIVLTSIV